QKKTKGVRFGRKGFLLACSNYNIILEKPLKRSFPVSCASRGKDLSSSKGTGSPARNRPANGQRAEEERYHGQRAQAEPRKTPAGVGIAGQGMVLGQNRRTVGDFPAGGTRNAPRHQQSEPAARDLSPVQDAH